MTSAEKSKIYSINDKFDMFNDFYKIINDIILDIHCHPKKCIKLY